MNNQTYIRPTVARLWAALGLCAVLAVPSPSVAATHDEPEPTPATDDCAESTVSVEIDTLTGNVYVLDEAGNPTLVDDNELNVFFGGQSRVLLHLQYTVGEWEVEISSGGSTTETFETSGGSLRYFIDPDVEQYTFSSTEVQSSASTMMSMAPVPPGDIIIMPDPDCPPD